IGESLELDTAYKWIQSDKTLVSVDNGIVKALEAGDDYIYGYNESTSEVQVIQITIKNSVSKFLIDEESVKLYPGEERKLTYRLVKQSSDQEIVDNTIQWSVSKTGVVEVRADGTIKAISPGECVVTGITNDG
ncbi:hypothetical protein ADUPG1_003027, partial [Aduncisulcus paluster]